MSHPVWERFYPSNAHADFSPAPETLAVFFAKAVAVHRKRVALSYDGTEITYETLGAWAARVADGLRKRGVGPGQTVALYLANSPFHPIFFFGALLTGARVTHLSALDAKRELGFKLRDSQAVLLVALAEAPQLDMAAELMKDGVVTRAILCDEADILLSPSQARAALPAWAESFTDLISDTSDSLALPEVKPDDVALLQYTGGTTGMARAAALTHRNLTSAAHIYQMWFKLDPDAGPDAKVLAVLPLSHIMALVSILLRRLLEGGCLVLMRRFDVARVIDAIERKQITSMAGVPTMWIALANHPGIEKRDLSALRRIGSGGAPLPVEIRDRIFNLTGHNLVGGWGMTETCAAGTNLPLNIPEGKRGSAGLPLPGITLQIVDADNPDQILGVNEVGEIRIKGPNIANAYWRREADGPSSWREGFFYTGDLARMDEDGFIYIVDRKKDMIISSGFNVYPLAIENAVIEHPSVAEVMVIGVPDDYRGEAAKAFVMLKPGAAQFTLDELRTFLGDKLGRHELPQALAIVTSLPKTAVGKYSRKALREQELGKSG